MISCVLLAAGESRRFGSPKALATLGGQTVIGFLQRRLLETRLGEIIVVLGAEAPSVSAHLLQDPRIKTALNEDYALGQTSSFKVGLRATRPDAQGIFLLPVDMPAVLPGTIDRLIETFERIKPLILLPVCKGRSGHPPLFSISLAEEFLALPDDSPLNAVQHRHTPHVLRCDVDDAGVAMSFNTPEEFRKVALYLQSNP